MIEIIKRNRLVIFVVCSVIIVVTLIVFTIRIDKKKEYKLDKVYDVYPYEVRSLYQNMVDVSCGGDLELNIKPGEGKVDIAKLDKKILLSYVFSYMDKHNMLNGSINNKIINNTADMLFSDKVKLFNNGDKFNYGDYEYTFKNNKVVRKASKCNSDKKTITYLYGYFSDEAGLSMDVLVGYLKNGILYDYDNHELGIYEDDVSKLRDMLKNASYYRYNYIKKDNIYKLSSVEWNKKS